MIEPIHAMPTLIFNMEMKAGREEGMTSLSKICPFVAPMERKSNILSLSVSAKPLSIFMIEMMMPMRTVMTMIAFAPVPHQMMMRGPNAILGRAFNTTR
jgi:hypothetical protein